MVQNRVCTTGSEAADSDPEDPTIIVDPNDNEDPVVIDDPTKPDDNGIPDVIDPIKPIVDPVDPSDNNDTDIDNNDTDPPIIIDDDE